jgi:hypothetical protein
MQDMWHAWEGRGMHIVYLWEREKERYHEEEQDVGESILLKWILERSDGVDWIDLSQDKDQWRALGNMVMNLRVP